MKRRYYNLSKYMYLNNTQYNKYFAKINKFIYPLRIFNILNARILTYIHYVFKIYPVHSIQYCSMYYSCVYYILLTIQFFPNFA